MADSYITIGSSGMKKRVVDLGNNIYADATKDVTVLETERILAAATGSDGGLGKIGTVEASSGILYVHCDCSDRQYSGVEWRVSCNKSHDVQLYKARSVADAPTLTLSSMANTETIIVNGLTFTAHTDTNVWANRQYAIDGVLDGTDAAELASVIMGGAYVTVAAPAALDTVTVEGITFTAHADTTTPTSRQFAINGTNAQDAAALVLCINHRANVTLSSVTNGDTITINGLVFTAHTDTTDASLRQFSIAGTNSQDGDELVTCVNDATYGVPGITAENASGVVSFLRDTADDAEPTITSSNGTRLALETAKGVAGYKSGITDGAEVAIWGLWDTSDWATVTTSNGTRLATGTYGVPGVVIDSLVGAVITLAPAATNGATVIKAVSGTAGGHCVVSNAGTLTGLCLHGAAVTGVADNTATNGTIYSQDTNSWEHCYISVTNKDGANAATVIVAASPRL